MKKEINLIIEPQDTFKAELDNIRGGMTDYAGIECKNPGRIKCKKDGKIELEESVLSIF